MRQPQSKKRHFRQPKHTHLVQPWHIGERRHPLGRLLAARSSASLQVILKQQSSSMRRCFSSPISLALGSSLQYRDCIYSLVVGRITTLPPLISNGIVMSSAFLLAAEVEPPLPLALGAANKLIAVEFQLSRVVGFVGSQLIVLHQRGLVKRDLVLTYCHPNVAFPIPTSLRMPLKLIWCQIFWSSAKVIVMDQQGNRKHQKIY